jgi:hypothetical protein
MIKVIILPHPHSLPITLIKASSPKEGINLTSAAYATVAATCAKGEGMPAGTVKKILAKSPFSDC